MPGGTASRSCPRAAVPELPSARFYRDSERALSASSQSIAFIKFDSCYLPVISRSQLVTGHYTTAIEPSHDSEGRLTRRQRNHPGRDERDQPTHHTRMTIM